MDKEIYCIITQYKHKLESLGIMAKRIILYGSHAKREASKESDIDLVVVSDDLKDIDMWQRLSLLGYARIGIKKPMEILGLTEEEFAAEGAGSFFADEVKSNGVEVI